jgi:hypothetical protein
MRLGLPAACLLAVLCTAGHAACETGLAERMSEKLHPKRTLDHERAVCEPWRGQQGRYIVVLPLRQSASDPYVGPIDLDVLVVQQADNGNTDHARIVSRLYEEGALTEDVVHIGEIKLDTARYRLAPDVHAFGLRVLRQGSSRADPFSDETLTLYVPQGAKLAKVLDELEMRRERGASQADCGDAFETVRGSLTVARGASNGYADLILRQSRFDSRSVMQGDECVTQEEPASADARLLRYDGKEYQASKAAPTE